MKVKPGASNDIVGSRKVHGVKMANSVFGRYDAVLVIAAKDEAELASTLYDVIEKHPNVERTECLISVPQSAQDEDDKRQPVRDTESFSIISFQCPSCNLLNERGPCSANSVGTCSTNRDTESSSSQKSPKISRDFTSLFQTVRRRGLPIPSILCYLRTIPPLQIRGKVVCSWISPSKSANLSFAY